VAPDTGRFAAVLWVSGRQKVRAMRLSAHSILLLVFVAALTCTMSGAVRRGDPTKADKPEPAALKTEEAKTRVPNPSTVALVALGAGGLVLRQLHQWRRPSRKRQNSTESWV
jgi:hypothetical protein